MSSENTKETKAALNRQYKFLNWGVHVKEYEAIFNSICSLKKSERYFESLYVSKEHDCNQIQLFTGQHPIGSQSIQDNTNGNILGYKLVSEHGATLVISQAVTGQVAIILYPYTSEKLSRQTPYILWAVFSDPSKITRAVLNKAIDDFFCYIRVSSALFSESLADNIKIRYLEQKSQILNNKNGIIKTLFNHWVWIFLGAIGSVASIYSILK